MSIRLPPRKATYVRQACEDLLHQNYPLIVSSFPGVQYGELYYRYLEQDKSQALQANRGDYHSPMNLLQEARSDLHWWVNNVTFAFRNITQTNPDLTLTTDASTIGWGQYMRIKKRWIMEFGRKSFPYPLVRTEGSSVGYEILTN